MEIMKELETLKDSEIRIIKLNPFKLAYYRHESSSPEEEAWKTMLKWIKKNDLANKFSTRYFGFNNPNPSKDSPIYGYEVWVTIDKEFPEDENVKYKEFDGGLYLVTNAKLHNITERWFKLHKYVENSKYEMAQHQSLEEHLIYDDKVWLTEDMQFDLYYPVKLK